MAVVALLAGCASTDYDLGRRALDAGDPATALTHFDAAIQAGLRVQEATREKGAAQLAAGEFAAAITTLESVRSQLPADQRTLWLLGQSYSKGGQPADAAAVYGVYEALTSRRSVRKQLRLRIAQLRAEVDQNEANQILAQQAGGVIPDANSVAVFAFTTAQEDASLQDQKICRALNIWVTADLAKVEGMKVIAASQLDLIYREQKFTYENRQSFQPSSLVRTGNVQPARHLIRGVYGSVAGVQISLGAACYDSAENMTDTCSTLDGTNEDLFDLENQLVLDILAALSVTPTAAEMIAIGEKPTRNLDAFLAFADGVYLREIGNLEAASAAFSEAAKIDPGFSMAKEFQSATDAQAMGESPIQIAAPKVFSTAQARAKASANQLGLGLIPDEDSGDQQGGGTNDVTTARGNSTLRVRARTGGGD